jgi:hydroxymethylpyrimidine kinase/phosphomethylpyrimidine kinase/thiamine-phosphate diphosphorylase
MKKTLWTIAGSDAGGGAGIQADIKTMASFGLQGSTVITALTAQNSAQVLAINPVSIELLNSQLSALEQDKPPQVIKIGLLANIEQVVFIADKISHYKNTWSQAPLIVYDPVAVASTGDSLVEEDILTVVKEKLLPLVDVLTPNTAETQRITGVYLISSQAVIDAGEKFKKLGVKSVVIKGGHWDLIDDYCIDYAAVFVNILKDNKKNKVQQYWLGSKNIATMHSHGTGCSFASAMAACLTLDYPFKDAFIIAKAYINQGLKSAKQNAYGIGSLAHCGFPEKLNDFPEVIEQYSQLGQLLELNNPKINTVKDTGFARCEQPLGLYAVVDNVAWLELCLAQGIKTVQLRIKSKNKTAQYISQAISQAVKISKPYHAQLFINDHWQLAIEHGAYGVHLGQEDLEYADLARIKNAGLRLGISTHGFYEMLRAHNYQPSYMAFGAVYPTSTKDMTGQIQGLEKLRHFVPLMKVYDKVAIGGITLECADEVLATGINSIAVVSAITKAEQPVLAINQLLVKL